MNELEVNAKIQALVSQRDMAMNNYVNLFAETAKLEARVAELEKELAESRGESLQRKAALLEAREQTG